MGQDENQLVEHCLITQNLSLLDDVVANAAKFKEITN